MEISKIKDLVIQGYKEGNISVASGDGLQSMSLNEFIKQPIDGMLYDLNRGEGVILTFIDDIKWINDFAATKVLRAIHQQCQELKEENKKLVEANGWKNVEDSYPICTQTGMWDGKRSEFVLVEDESGARNIGRVYSGALDGSEFNDFYDNRDFEIKNVKLWREI